MLRLKLEDAAVYSGHVLVYVPQPLDSKQIMTHTFPLVSPDDDTDNSSEWVIRMPPDATKHCLWFWWFDFHGRTQANQVCESRQGTGKFDLPPKLSVGDTIDIAIKRAGSGITINTLTFRVFADHTFAAPADAAVAAMDGKEDSRIALCINAAEDFYSSVKQKVEHLREWQVGQQAFPVGPMPPWAFLIQPNQPQRVQAQLPSLLRLLQVASHRLRIAPSVLNAPDKWSIPLRCELMCEMATFLAMACAYRLDAQVSYGSDEHDREPVDQWVHPLVMPKLDEVGADCEDLTSIVITVLRLLQEVQPPSVVANGPQWLAAGLRSICELACQYVFCMAIGSLRLGHDKFTYHAYTVAIDRDRVMGAVNTDDKKQQAVPSKDPVPLLTLEGTEYTTSCMEYKGGPDADTFDRLNMSDLCAHAKIPASMIRNGPQYHEVVTLFAPQLWTTTGVCEWALMTKSGVNGVQHKLLRQWGSIRKPSREVSMVPVTAVTPKQMHAVVQRAAQLPHADGLPPVLQNEFGFMHDGDRKMTPGTLTYFGRPMDLMDPHRQRAIDEAIHTSLPGAPPTVFTRLDVLQGVSIVRVDTPASPSPKSGKSR